MGQFELRQMNKERLRPIDTHVQAFGLCRKPVKSGRNRQTFTVSTRTFECFTDLNLGNRSSRDKIVELLLSQLVLLSVSLI